MHQTFYIDIDEEITSIVERLRDARASEIILVVPKRALLIQSIVNLRILKREADEARLQLMIVTQDKLGKILIEKAGIFVQQKMDNISDEEIEMRDEPQLTEEYATENENIKNNNSRLDQIGSTSYFNAVLADNAKKEEAARLEREKLTVKRPVAEKEELVNKELVFGMEKKPTVNKPSFDLQSSKSSANTPLAITKVPTGRFEPSVGRSPIDRSNNHDEIDFSDKKIADFFQQSKPINRQIKKEPVKERSYDTYKLSNNVHRWFWMFGAVAFLAVVGVLAYLFIPKVNVVVSVKLDTQSIDAQITGRTDAMTSENAKEIISAKVLAVDQEVSESYMATGAQQVSNQKAHGTITIYNEYSSTPQPLVATTRFLTDDGKIFRLNSGVTVPGTSVVDGQTQSGQVTAGVMADSPGDSYNIGPSTFNIPGFKSSGDKYNKIYAKSTVAMTGGGDGAGEVKMITDNDIAAAKNKILTELNNKIEAEIKSAGGDGTVILDGALNESDVVYSFSNSSGDVADSFQVSASASAKALTVKQNNLDSVIADMLNKKANGKNIDASSIVVTYSRSDADFVNGTLGIKFHAIANISPDFTTESIKKAILGKSEADIKTYLSGFSNVQKMEVEYWPSFAGGRIPFQSSRVAVTIDAI